MVWVFVRDFPVNIVVYFFHKIGSLRSNKWEGLFENLLSILDLYLFSLKSDA